MGKVLVLALLLLGSLAAGAHGGNPHREAHRCQEEFLPGCDRNCEICHSLIGTSLKVPALSGPADFFADLEPPAELAQETLQGGDVPLCMECHPEKGGNLHGHPVARLYRPGRDRKYVDDPEGPKLFRDEGGNRWIFCSTCHDPHHGAGKGLRRKGPEASLCQACHIK